jgi:hypothetical protein
VHAFAGGDRQIEGEWTRADCRDLGVRFRCLLDPGELHLNVLLPFIPQGIESCVGGRGGGFWDEGCDLTLVVLGEHLRELQGQRSLFDFPFETRRLCRAVHCAVGHAPSAAGVGVRSLGGL